MSIRNFFDLTDPTHLYYDPLPDHPTEEDLEQYQHLTLQMLVRGIVMFLSALVILAVVSLLSGCATPKAVEEHHHHHYESDTMAVQALVDRRLSSWHEEMTQYLTQRLEQTVNQQQQTEQQHETVTETVTETVDSIGRRIRQEQRTISRDITREMQQVEQRMAQEVQAQLRTAIDSVSNVWQQRYDSLSSRVAAADSVSSATTPVAVENPSAWQRFVRKLLDLLICVVVVGGLILYLRRKVLGRWG